MESIYNLANIFFTFNHSNYARWILKYLSNLLNLKKESSVLLQDFKRGAFGVKRTSGNFARLPVDITLEQTINADAANSMTGITHFTNSISARQRWSLSHSMRTKILSKLLEEINITSKDDVSHELKQNRIYKDREALNNILNEIKKNINPFDPTIDKDQLFNITTGKATTEQISNFLLNADILGQEQKDEFLEKCGSDPDRFEQSIKRNKILNFASDCIKRKISKDGSKEVLIKMERDVFGKLLAIALEKKIDMEECLSYPLAPAPPALCHITGEMHKTDKSALAKKIKSKIQFSIPLQTDVDLIDGFYFLHILGSSIPQTFGKISELILIRICNTKSTEVHLVFDRYFFQSIKDSERCSRESIDIPYIISGTSQNRPIDFSKSLKNKKFKEALVQFLANDWQKDSMACILANKKIFITVEEKCFSFVSNNHSVKKVEEPDFACYHEEADTRLIYHISKLKPNSKIMVKASDTDILIILLGSMHKFDALEIWLNTANPKNKDQSCINCTELSNILGQNLCCSLPAFHAFTGCDYTAAFYRKGKVKPFEILEKNEKYQTAFQHLNNPSDILDEKNGSNSRIYI